MFTAEDFREGEQWSLVDDAEDGDGDYYGGAYVRVLNDGVDHDGEVYVLIPDWGVPCDADCADPDDCDGHEEDVYSYFTPDKFATCLTVDRAARGAQVTGQALPPADSITIEQILNYTS